MKGYIRIATFSIDTIRNLHEKYLKDKNYIGYPIKNRIKYLEFEFPLGSRRLLNFHFNGTQCQNCGLQGSFYSLDMVDGDKSNKKHINLIAVTESGEEKLMVAKHTSLKTGDGKNLISNQMTLCQDCNN